MIDEFTDPFAGDDEDVPMARRFAITPLLDTEIDVAAVGWVGLTPEVDHALRMDVTSAVIARLMACSVRTAAKYGQGIGEHIPRDQLIRDLCRSHLRHYDNFYRTMGVRSGNRIGIFAFDLAMIRSRASLGLMLITARQGFLIEPCLMARSLMEQFAYALRVWETDEDDVIFGSKPQSLIRWLIAVNPNAGRAYGMLSRLSHYDPKMHHSFIGGPERNAKNEESSTVIQRSWKFKIVSLAWIFFILDLKFAVFERCYGSHEGFVGMDKIKRPVRDTYDEFFEGVDLPVVDQVRKLLRVP